MLSHRTSLRTFAAAAFVLLATLANQAIAQDANSADAAAPAGMPPEIQALFAPMSGGVEVAVAPEEPNANAAAGAGLAPTNYLYTTLRVVSNSGPRGCAYAGWDCMTNLCRADLQDTAAWRGWAGCWKRDAWICYFECGQRRQAF